MCAGEPGEPDCTVPYFGFKAKPVTYGAGLPAELYCALFWIQGKTVPGLSPLDDYCTVPYFGFKAKPIRLTILSAKDCTVPYFGFKAKQMRLRSDGAGDCSAFGRAIPDGFLSVFL